MSDEAADREHPTAEKLSAYLANELSPEEDDAIQEHIANCSLCAERLLELQRFLEFVPEPSDEKVADFETTREWKRLWERIEKERAPSRSPEVATARRPRWNLGSAPAAYALAAVLAFALIGLSIYTARLRQELRGVEMNPPEYFISPFTGTRGSTEEIVDLAPGVPKITLRLLDLQGTTFSRYRLEIKDPQGQLHLRRDDLIEQNGMFIFRLPTKELTRGQYSIKVWGLGADGSVVEIDQYKFRVRQ